MNNHEYGWEGEDMARSYLEEKGYMWRETHFSTKWGEIDLVMQKGRILVFVEVKRRRFKKYGDPELAVNKNKQRHMARSAIMYVQRNKIRDMMIRFDVISIGPHGMKHFPNAFETDGQYYF